MTTNPNFKTPARNSSEPFVTFEYRLSQDSRWALGEGSLFFENKGVVQETLRRIARRLDEIGIPYAVVGGMALFHHGYRRFTENIDILVTRDGLKSTHAALNGRGYKRSFERSKNLRDVESGVRINLHIAGEFPGDGKPKDVQFPSPQSAAVEIAGIKFVDLPILIELKLASGMTAPDRLKDLADVQETIKALQLPLDFAQKLNESVREQYAELWNHAQRDAHYEP